MSNLMDFWKQKRDEITDTSHLFKNTRSITERGGLQKDKDEKVKEAFERTRARIIDYKTSPEYLKEYEYFDPIDNTYKKTTAARAYLICAVYTDYSDLYEEVHWLQTIETDYGEEGQSKEFIDEGDYGIFYDQSEDYELKTERGFIEKGFMTAISPYLNFTDFPSRPTKKSFYFLATLSLIGVNSDGSLDRITTIRWGYNYNKNKNKVYLKPDPVEFDPKRISRFHLDVINNPQKYMK